MPPKKGQPDYDRYRDKKARESRERSAHGKEIGPLPNVKDQPRKDRCRESLRLFCETYFPRRFYLGWASFHLTALERMERCVRDGGLFTIAQPRGSGKDTTSDCAVLYAILYGFRRYVAYVAASEPLATRCMKRLQAELERNDLLAEDFPEACHPIRRLEGETRRANGQTLGGERTQIGMTADGIVLPTVAGSACSGARLRVAGITGAIRGLMEVAPDGTPIRPDLVIVNDPQTRDSAKSITQTRDRVAVVQDDILGLAGPDVTIAAVMLCTVIYQGDLSDQFLDREKNPEWRGERTKMLVNFPEKLDLWDQYWELPQEQRNDFYAERQADLDAGAAVSWPDRMKKGELSAIQSAMNLYLRNPRGFRAEYQNEPDPEDVGAASKELDAGAVAGKLARAPRGDVPRDCTRLTAFVDCSKRLLWWAVVAWDERFNGQVVDYGCFPGQARSYFTQSDARPSLADVFAERKLSEPQLVYAGLESVTAQLLGRDFRRQETGEPVRIERCLIDANWLPDTVYQFCRQSPFAAVILPSIGHASSSNRRPISEWKKLPGQRVGRDWRIMFPESGRGRRIVFDPDSWKSFVADRLLTPPGGAGCLQLFGERAEAHQLFADHLTAEYATRVTVGARTFDKWAMRPGREDNHWLDCLVGAAVAVSVQGLVWTDAPAEGPKQATKRKRLDIEEAYRQAQGR